MHFSIHPDHEEVKIATTGIVCYKILNKHMSSIYYNFAYKFSQRYANIPLIKQKNHFSIEKYIIKEGYHSFITEWIAQEELWFLMKQYSNSEKILILVQGRIPKDAQYYFNPDKGEYISEDIIIHQQIK